MSDSWQHARGLAKQLQRELPEHSEISDELRARLEHVVTGALHARARSRRLRSRGFVASGFVAAGVAAALVVALRVPASRAVESGLLAKREGGPALLEGTLSLELAGAEATAVAVGAALPLDTSAVLRSGPRTTLQILPGASIELRNAVVRVESFGQTAAYFLDAGAVGVDAAAGRRRFAVRTGDATASSDDARFEVERAGSECGRTRVVVHRGVVEVRTARSIETVASGGEWSDCGRTIAPQAAANATSATASRSLEEQNDALALAVTARREGRTDDAVRAYARFLRRWPNGPLSEVARTDQMNLLAARDPIEGARAAREYLRLHPYGPAANRARELSKEGSK